MELLKHFHLDVQRPGWNFFTKVFVNKNGGAYDQLRKEHYRLKDNRFVSKMKKQEAERTLKKILPRQ